MLKNSGLLFGRYFLYLHILFLSDHHFLFRLLFFIPLTRHHLAILPIEGEIIL